MNTYVGMGTTAIAAILGGIVIWNLPTLFDVVTLPVLMGLSYFIGKLAK